MESETCVRCGKVVSYIHHGDGWPPGWGTVQLEVVGQLEWGYVCEQCFEHIRGVCGKLQDSSV